MLRELSTWVERWKLASVDPEAPWAQRGSWLSDAEVSRFAAQGGADAALKALRPHMPKGATPFESPDPLYYKVPLPAGVPADVVEQGGPEALGKAVAPALKEDVKTSRARFRWPR